MTTKQLSTIYVVHTIPDERRQTFSDYPKAFKAFKEANKKSGFHGAALWAGDKKNGWIKRHSNDWYPQSLTQPHQVELV